LKAHNIGGKAPKKRMDSEDDYEYEINTQIPTEQGYAVENEEKRRKRANSHSSSENRDDYDDPPVLSPIHTMDIPSVRRPPVPVMVPADQVSTHDLPLAETLSVKEREVFHTCIIVKMKDIYQGREIGPSSTRTRTRSAGWKCPQTSDYSIF